jgi:hypothetical protein
MMMMMMVDNFASLLMLVHNPVSDAVSDDVRQVHPSLPSLPLIQAGLPSPLVHQLSPHLDLVDQLSPHLHLLDPISPHLQQASLPWVAIC